MNHIEVISSPAKAFMDTSMHMVQKHLCVRPKTAMVREPGLMARMNAIDIARSRSMRDYNSSFIQEWLNFQKVHCRYDALAFHGIRRQKED